MSRTMLIAGNWKMNGDAGQVDAFARSLAADASAITADMLVCVPFVYIERLVAGLADAPVAVGGQNVAAEVDAGAFTGEVNGAMLADIGCRYVIVGHSERRAMYGETDSVVAAKTSAAVAVGLTPIVCVGETLEQREADQTEAVLAAQIGALFEQCDARTLAEVVIAYEPIWAIGTGRSASPEQAQDVHAFLRGQIADRDATISESVLLLYGGSVKPDNAAALFAGADVDGALIGGASLKADSFLDIARAAG
ncbi:Triosephosphate isomerase protein [Salinisphaera shabanensis E1L3A]|uniref:Triosephosphate isomerase n=1 Tax=Salinisphaera shabanensis E1L3A TaxID=1033802 RepID=U2EK59_9GAMM|nr:triose-phosphate isomerase [Salinisphaera shabanensis]ERJ18657.1 Triosephosphate isomerase protein [Salinisphaera shabanensis E1L3A]